MRPFRLLLGLLIAASAAAPQTQEYFQVSGEPPLLLLRQQRLRLLRRERERHSPRWEQFDRLISGRAATPEPGLALALYYQVTGEEAAGRRAVEWSLGPGADLRQLALVFDWRPPQLSESQIADLARRLQRALEAPPRTASVAEARDRTFAAVALAGHAPALSERELRRIVEKWWRGDIVRAVRSGRDALPRAEMYALFEMLHAIRDNLAIDLRTELPKFFLQLPELQLIGYYPAVYPAPENDYRIPAVKGAEPDLNLAIQSRAAELAMVAFDANMLENQFLQGWLMHDRFMMRSPAGIAYELLWANPYQPGLSYFKEPLAFHDPIIGRVFLRSRWDDDADWAGYFDGQLQTFSNGEPKIQPLRAASEPLQFGDAAIVSSARFKIQVEARTVYIVGLRPSTLYAVEPDFHEVHEARTDPGGVLELSFPTGFRGAIRVRPAR